DLGVLRAEPLLAEATEDVLEPRARLVVALAERVEEPDDRLAHAPDLGGGDEVVQRDGRLRRRRQPAGRVHLEAALPVPHLRDEPEVVDRGVRTVRPAAAERDLELPREGARERVPQEEARDGLSVRRDVE